MDKVFQNLLIHTLNVYKRDEGISNEWNLPSESLVLVATIKGLVQPLKDSITIERRGQKEEASFACFISYSDKDSVDLDYIIEFESEKYQILGILNEAGQNHHLKLLLKKL